MTDVPAQCAALTQTVMSRLVKAISNICCYFCNEIEPNDGDL